MTATGKISVSKAVQQVLERHNFTVTIPTMIRWCREYGLGIQLGSPGGRWIVDSEKLEKFMTSGTYQDQKEDK